MLAKRVFYAPPGALAEHVNSSRMNWKVKLHPHGSSLMIDSDIETAKWYLFEPQTKSMRQRAPPKTGRTPQRGLKKRAELAENQTNQQLLKRVVKNNKNEKTVTS